MNTVSPGTFLSGGVKIVARGHGGAARHRPEQPRGPEPDHRGGLRRAVAISAARACPTRSARDRVPRLAPQQLHDRRERERGRRLGLRLMRRRSRAEELLARGARAHGARRLRRPDLPRGPRRAARRARARRALRPRPHGLARAAPLASRAAPARARTGSRAIPRSIAQAVPAPVFVVGLPRTGTTALSHLLAQDPDDALAARLGVGAAGAAARDGDASTATRASRTAAKQLAAMHQLSPRLAAMHEDTRRAPPRTTICSA